MSPNSSSSFRAATALVVGDPPSASVLRLERRPPTDGAHAGLDAAVAAAEQAYRALGEISVAGRHHLITAMRAAALAEVPTLARLSLEETGLGRYEDKVAKNKLAIEKTPGVEILAVESHRGEEGLCIEDLAPWGVIGVITPCTNPTETIINNAISMIAAGNTLVICPHPSARKVSLYVVALLNRAIVAAGGPPCLLNVLAEPSVELARGLMGHPRIRTLTVTGGPDVVRAAMASGKNVIAAGPGNPPVVVDETADIDAAARRIVAGASFDNNIVCVDEKQVVCVEEVAKALLEALAAHEAVVLGAREVARLLDLVLLEARPGPEESRINKAWVGKDASKILEAIGVRAPADVRLVVAPTAQEHPFVWSELLMPILAVTTAPTADDAIDLAVRTERGNGHTALIHSQHLGRITKMARLARTSIFVANGTGVSGLGAGAEGHTSFTIASPTGHGLTTARTFSRRLRTTAVGAFARN